MNRQEWREELARDAPAIHSSLEGHFGLGVPGISMVDNGTGGAGSFYCFHEPSGVLAVSRAEQQLDRNPPRSWIYLKEALTGKELRKLDSFGLMLEDIAFSPDGRLLAAASAPTHTDQVGMSGLKVWDVKIGKDKYFVAGDARRVRFSADGRRLFAIGAGGRFTIHDTETGLAVLTLAEHSDVISTLGSSRDGKVLYTAYRDGSLRVWDGAAGQEKQTLRGLTGPLALVSFIPNRSKAVSMTRAFRFHDCYLCGGDIKLWSFETGKPLVRLAHDSPDVTALAVSPDGRLIATAHLAAGLDGRMIVSAEPEAPFLQHRYSLDQQGQLRHVDNQSPTDGKETTRKVETQPSVVRIWKDDGMLLHTLKCDSSPIVSLAFHPDGAKFVTGSTDGRVRLWDAIKGREQDSSLYTFNFEREAGAFQQDFKGRVNGNLKDIPKDSRVYAGLAHITGLVFHPDGKQLAIGMGFGLALIDLDERSIKRIGVPTLTHPFGCSLFDLQFTADGKVLGYSVANWEGNPALRIPYAVSLDNNRVESLSLTSNSWKYRREVAASGLNHFRLSADGSLAFVSGDENKIVVLDKKGVLMELHGHTDEVASLDVSPDGRYLISGSDDRTIKLWDLQELLPKGLRDRPKD